MSLIIEWLFPRSCLGCGKGGKYICDLCEIKMKNGSLSQKKLFEGIISVYKYDGLMKEVVEKVKYEFISDAVKELAELMGNKLKISYPNIVKYWQKEKFCLIPIPLYWQRKNWRGFNQSEILANCLAKELNLKCDNHFLQRNRNTKNQASLRNRQLRQQNVEEVFETEKKKIRLKNVILVDDVVTSGATMNAAGRTLKDSGVDLLWGLSVSGALK